MTEHYTEQAWQVHPGRNPEHVFGGYDRWVSIPDPRCPGHLVRVLVHPRNPSRWLPHQSTREMERRRRRMAA